MQCEGLPVAQKQLSQMAEILPAMIGTWHLGIQEESTPASKNGGSRIMQVTWVPFLFMTVLQTI